MKLIKTNTYFIKAIVCSLLLFLFYDISYAQNKITFDKLTVEDGLSQTSIVSITQDSMGFMWFGSKDGLNRYDSRHFEVFKNIKNDEFSLSASQNINALLTDKKGNIWVGTQKGLNQYIAETKTFKRYLNIPNNNKSLSNNTIRCLYQDDKENIWVGTENGLNKLNPDGSFERFFCKDAKWNKLINPLIKAIYQDKNRNIWVGSQAGLAKINFDNKQGVIETFYHQNDDESSLAANDITSINEDFKGNIWIGTHFNGLDFLAKNQRKFLHYNTKNSGIVSNIIRKLLVDNQGKIWIATINGLSIFDTNSAKFSNLNHNPNDNTSLNQNSIYDLYQDQSGSIWVGTYYGGINVHHQQNIPFQIFKHNPNQNSVSSNIISALAEDNQNNLWIGTEAEGLNYFDKNTNTFTSYKHKNSENSISSNLIKSVVLDQKNNLWIAAYEGGVDYFDTKTKVFKNYQINGKSLNAENRITDIGIDKNNIVWVASKGNGLFYYDAITDKFVSCLNKNAKVFFPFLNILQLFISADNTLWITTDEGFFYIKNNSKKPVKVSSLKTDFFNQISTINQLSTDEIVLGSFSGGLGILNLDKLSLRNITTKNGLSSNNITYVIQDKANILWISTDKGLNQLIGNSINVYNVFDGLPGNVFNYHSGLKAKDGSLYFGGFNGFVKFNSSDININKNIPKIVFTDLKFDNQVVKVNPKSDFLYKSLNQIPEIVFSHDQNVFSIDFASLNYIKPQKNKFAYKINGLDGKWNEINIPTVNFTNLPSGKYELLVKASNNDGVWNENYKKLKIIIRPPFWLTWWAYIIYLSAFGCVLYLIFRYLLIKASLKKEHEVNEMKLAFFTNVSHEIRTPLTLILGPLEKLAIETLQSPSLNAQIKLVNHNAKRLKRLISELMDFRKIESGNLNLKVSNHNIVDFCCQIFKSFEQLAKQLNVNYEFVSSVDELETYFDHEQLEKVIYNLLSNAFKFIPEQNPEVSLTIETNKNQVLIKVIDNGKGINKADIPQLFTSYYQSNPSEQKHQGTGIGLALSRSIARLHQGDLYLDTSNNKTTFSLSLLIGKAHFSQIDNVLIQENKVEEVYELKSDVETKLTAKVSERNFMQNSVLPNLLLVDDNEEIIDFLEVALQKHYQIIKAKDGLQALDLAFEHIPDLIISDVMMPNLDGYGLCGKIKTDERTRHIPLILLTARTGELQELDGLKKGADVYLTKPFSIQKLKIIIDNLLALQYSMRQKFSQQLSIQPSAIEVESSDDEFLQKALLIFEKNLTNSDFNVNTFAAEIGMSTPVFYKKINALTGLTVNNFMKSIRLKRAMQLLEKKAGNISEIAYMVGFNDSKYFSKEFRKQFGKSPSNYI